MKAIKHRYYKKCMSLVVTLLLTSSLLLGCTGVMQPVDNHYTRHSLTSACTDASLLITNLIVGRHHRRYQLPDGQPCREMNDDTN